MRRTVICFLSLFALSATPQQQRFNTGAMPPPRFADADRARKLAAAFPEVERIFMEWVERRHAPGAILGVIVDGELVWTKAAGVRDVETRQPVGRETRFRIASMTKSFTATAIMQLRDQGKLNLDEPVAKYIPQIAALPYPTKDSPVITIRHLLTHSEGFPEDNPWGDRQLAQPNETMEAWVKAGIPFSNAPGVAYEYSNYGFALLGRIVENVSGKPYPDYIRENILTPLGMRSSTLDTSAVPRDAMAPGYRWEDEKWKAEPILAHGSFGAMGGMWTTVGDLARYVAFHLSAFPPRDDAETGPIKRSSSREMQQGWRSQPGTALRRTADGPLELRDSAYGYGLSVSSDCRFRHIVGHGGGLPGYGSYMQWLPEYGVGMIAMSNLTYGAPAPVINDAFNALLRTGALKPRAARSSPALLAAKADVSQLIMKWDDALANRIAADNLFLDRTAARRSAELRELSERHGHCRDDGAIDPENALRGRWRMSCERGWLNVAITLAPTSTPRVQYMQVDSVIAPSEAMAKRLDTVMQLSTQWSDEGARDLLTPDADRDALRRQLKAMSAWGQCRRGEALAGDGERDSTVKLECDGGNLAAHLIADPVSGRLRSVELTPPRGERCAP